MFTGIVGFYNSKMKLCEGDNLIQYLFLFMLSISDEDDWVELHYGGFSGQTKDRQIQ